MQTLQVIRVENRPRFECEWVDKKGTRRTKWFSSDEFHQEYLSYNIEQRRILRIESQEWVRCEWFEGGKRRRKWFRADDLRPVHDLHESWIGATPS